VSDYAPLPSDPDDWPKDPYEILGVPAHADPKTVKRAYTKLIRQYKPEHAPKEFGLIREAYESALRFAEMFAASDPISLSEPARESSDPSNPDAPREKNAEDYWELAVRGQEAEAYAGFQELLKRFPQRFDLYARLYWLLILGPDLDSQKEPLDWLIEGMKMAGFHPSLVQLYEKEIEQNPEEIRKRRSRDLLKAKGPTANMALFARVRWLALFALDEWEQAGSDFPSLKESIRSTDDFSWLRLIVLGLSWVDWVSRENAPAMTFRANCRRELKELDAVVLQNQEMVERLEPLHTCATAYREILPEAPHLKYVLETMRLYWCSQDDRWMTATERAMYTICQDPLKVLEQVDLDKDAYMLIFRAFDLSLRDYAGYKKLEDSPQNPEVLYKVVGHLGGRYSAYLDYRAALLNYLLTERVDPDQLGDQSWAPFHEALKIDIYLQAVCRAHRLLTM